MSEHEHTDDASEECATVLAQVYQFLDNELDTASGEAIREHLAACEPCLDEFDVEQAVKALVHRCCGNDRAPETLRAKVMLQITTVRSTTIIS